MRRMRIVRYPAWGISPPRICPELPRSTRRGSTDSLQYGQTRSLVVMKARQCGHMRRVSIVNSMMTRDDASRRSIVCAQAANPDVAITDGILVVLKRDRELGFVRPIPGDLAVDHRAHHLLPVV